MARYTGSLWKKSRRLGFSVLETGEELTKRAYAPGQHGPTRRVKLTNYGLQLQEKQRIRFLYGVNEKQFYNTYLKAEKMAGVKGHNFLNLLESRLDNIVYRMGFASTRRQARQLVNHGHILVNGKKVDIPSYSTKVGSVIEVKEKSKNLNIVKESLEARINTLPFVEVDKEARKGVYVRLPERNELNTEINELLVVEYYNR
ncbi:MAG: 30S ribosomal protein S4 [Erysipelotrichaceae bacterium]